MAGHLTIFDLDGTLYDTLEVHYLSYQAALREQGFPLNRDFFTANCFGHHFSDFICEIAPGASAETQKRIHERKLQLYPDYLCHARENAGLFAMIGQLRPDWKTAVVSTASRAGVESILTCFGRKDLFDLILTQEDIPRPKPDPQGFFMAMDHFSCSPAETVIFEDSDTGLRAAEATGASVFAVKHF